MEELTRKLLGYIEFEMEKGDFERFLTLCAKNEVRIWNIERKNGKITACTTISGYKEFLIFRRKTRAKIRITKKKGFPFFIKPILRRKGIVFGILAFILIYMFLSCHIWSVKVEGNEKISEAQLLSAAKELGLHTGALKKSINAAMIKEEIMYKFFDISWASVNTLGNTVTICVKEKTEKPEIIDKTAPSNVYASFSGQIIEIDTFGGTPKVKVGDAVTKGQMLISAVMQKSETEEYLVHAYGNVIARTRRVISTEILKEETVFTDTDEVVYRCSADILGVTIPLTLREAPKGSYKCEKTTFPFKTGEFELPITIYKEKWTKVNEEIKNNTKAEAEKRGKEELIKKFKEENGDKEIERVSFEIKETNNKYIITAAFICRENIAEVSPLIDKTPNFN